MSKSKTSYDLVQMHSHLESIRNNEIVETRLALDQVRQKLKRIHKNDRDTIYYNLQTCAHRLSLINKEEFSFLKIFGLEHNELVHSCILAWLLNPLESHGLNSLFVEKFFEKIGLDVNDFDFPKLCVEREVSCDKSRLDIRVYDPYGSFQCIIENKILSSEGVLQTSRLYEDFHNESYTKEIFIFLTLYKNLKPKDKRFKPMNYEEVLAILNELLSRCKDDTRFLIKHYSNTLERLIMSEKFEGFSERTQLYYQYYKDTCEIKKAFENDRKLLLDTLKESIKETKWWDDNVWRLEQTGSDINLWKESWYLKKNEGIYIQLYMYIESPGFAIRIYGEASDFATKVRPIFKRNINKKYPEGLLLGLKKTFGKGYTRFLEKEIHFSLTEKTQIKKVLENLSEIIELFDDIITESINELKEK